MSRAAFAGSSVAILAVLALGACSTPTTTPAGPSAMDRPSGEITVYNAQHESMTQAWVDAFTAETGIRVTMRQGKDTEMSNQIIQEGSASPADVFITENSPAMTQVENAGLLAGLDQDIIDQVPAQYRPSSNNWTGVAARSTVFVYNPKLLSDKDLPKSLLDLADPEWKGKWGASPSGADFQAIVSAVLEATGEAETARWLHGMKENATAYQGNGAVLKAVNAGEIAGGVIYHYYYYGDQAKTGENSGNVEQYYFKNQDPGAFVSISGGGVLKSSDNPAAAQAFLKFITGKAGQTLLATGNDFEYPIASGVAAHAGLVPLDELQPPSIDPAKLNSEKVFELMIAAGLL